MKNIRIYSMDMAQLDAKAFEVLKDSPARYTFIVKERKHWWSRWYYIMDGFAPCPHLFKVTELEKRYGADWKQYLKP